MKFEFKKANAVPSAEKPLGACIIKLFTPAIEDGVFGIVCHLMLGLTNTLAFYIVELIATVKTFILQTPGVGIDIFSRS